MQEKKLENQTDITKTVVGEFVEDTAKAKAKTQKQIDAVTEAVATAEVAEANAAKAAPKKTTAKKAAPAAKTAAPAAIKKEATVAKKTKTVTAKANNGAAKAAKAVKKGDVTKRIPDDAVLKVSKSFKNPFKEGSGPYKRFETCAKSNGKTYGALRAMASLKPTTPLNFVRAGGGEFISQGK